MKRIHTSIAVAGALMFMMTIKVSASVQSLGVWVDVTQPNGETFQVRMLGDRHDLWYETKSGYVVTQNPDKTWVYVQKGRSSKQINVSQTMPPPIDALTHQERQSKFVPYTEPFEYKPRVKNRR